MSVDEIYIWSVAQNYGISCALAMDLPVLHFAINSSCFLKCSISVSVSGFDID